MSLNSHGPGRVPLILSVVVVVDVEVGVVVVDVEVVVVLVEVVVVVDVVVDDVVEVTDDDEGVSISLSPERHLVTMSSSMTSPPPVLTSQPLQFDRGHCTYLSCSLTRRPL